MSLRADGLYSLAEVFLLTGKTEPEVRTAMRFSGIASCVRSGVEGITTDDFRQLMERLGEGPAPAKTELKPGFSASRLQTLMSQAIRRVGLNLDGLTVLTEAASSAYASTAILSAMAGAKRVYAITKASRYGSVGEITTSTMALASNAGVADRISVIERISSEVLAASDIVTNSGHLRPITAILVDQLPSRCVIGLMYETWEFRHQDIDIEACRRRHIPVAGVNERHPGVDVFSFLGPLAVKQMHDCGLAGYGNRIALLCDNDFSAFITRGLEGVGARVEVFSGATQIFQDEWDAIVVALRPGAELRINDEEASHLSTVSPRGTPCIQFWGDIDRAALERRGMSLWPSLEPRPGHMGILLSEIGPEPIVRLQAGGLRAAEWIYSGNAPSPDGIAQLL
jgi:hypothetical protein